MERIREVAVGVGQQDFTGPLDVAVVVSDLIEDAVGLDFARVAIVNAGEVAAVEVTVGPGGIAGDAFFADGADVLTSPFVELFAGGEARSVLGTDVPVAPVAAARG